MGSLAQWFVHLIYQGCMTLNQKTPVVSLSETLKPHCSVLVGSRNRLENCLFHNETNIDEYKLH